MCVLSLGLILPVVACERLADAARGDNVWLTDLGIDSCQAELTTL